MRIDLVDPPAFSPPYDDALAAALAHHGATVRLVTSRFAYGDAPAPDGYARDEFFYRHAVGPAGSPIRALSKGAEHLPDMLRYRRAARRDADVVHFQWLTVPRLDLRLLPDRPTVLTIHDPLERGRAPVGRDAFRGVDAIVVHSEYAKQAVIAQHGVDDDRIHVIRHGVLGTKEAFAPVRGENASRGASRLPAGLSDDGSPVVLSYGLIRPYKGLETLLQAWRGIENAELWVVGRPMMDLEQLTVAAPPGVMIVPRFVTPEEETSLFERADIVVLPYERSDRFGFSGVLATALGFGKAIVLSDVGGLSEVGSDPTHPAARLVAPGDAAALHAALRELIADREARQRLAAAAAHAATTTYSWDAAAAATLALYETIAGK